MMGCLPVLDIDIDIFYEGVGVRQMVRTPRRSLPKKVSGRPTPQGAVNRAIPNLDLRSPQALKMFGSWEDFITLVNRILKGVPKRAHACTYRGIQGNKGVMNYVVKDRYIADPRRWAEKWILKSIHRGKPHPVVVGMLFYCIVEGAGCGDRFKYRYGRLWVQFLTLDTPWNAPYAIYDLLENT